MSLGRIVSASAVRDLVKKGIVNRDGVRILDCVYTPSPPPDWKTYKYGKFAELMEAQTRQRGLFEKVHIPGAVHCDLDIATYPSQYERFTMYPADVFQEYIQLLGVNKDEHVIVYGRGAQGGMLFAAKVAWLLRSYRHEKVSLLNGGLDYWAKQKYEMETGPVTAQKGNFEAQSDMEKHNITFDELEAKDSEGKCLLDKPEEVDFLDARIRGQFEGTEDTGLDPYKVNGSHIPGFKNTPSAELISNDGLLKSDKEIKDWLATNGKLSPGRPIVTSCNAGLQAAFLSYLIEQVEPSTSPRVYCGSLKEMSIRDPKRISAGRRDLPH